MSQNNTDREAETFETTRRTVLQATIAGSLAGGGIGIVAGDEAASGKLTEGPDSGSSTPLSAYSQSGETSDESGTEVLLIKSCDPWGVKGNEQALSDLGYAYTRLPAEEARARQSDGSLNIDQYDAVLIPSTQSSTYYEALSDLQSTIDAYVEAGGTLIVHAGERGWPCGITGSMLEFPGGVDNKYTFDLSGAGVEITELQELSVIESDHPVVEGLDGSDLSYWASDISAFGHFEGLPDGARKIAGLTIDPQRHPTYVEYPFGDGRVLATTQALEWPFGDQNVRSGTERLLTQELEYAVETDPDPEPDPAPAKGRLTGTVSVESAESLADVSVYLVDPIREYAVSEYVAGERDSLPETVGETVTTADGTYRFEDRDPGRYLVLVDPAGMYDPTYERVSVPTGDTTRLSFTVEEARHLAALDPTFARIRSAARDTVSESTDDVSNVYVDGAQLFADDLGMGDYLPDALGATNFALGLVTPGGQLSAAVELKSFLAEQTVIPTVQYGYHRVLANEWDALSTRYRDELKADTDVCLSSEWITALNGRESVSNARTLFSSTDAYQNAYDDIDAAIERYEDDIAYVEPDEDFSMSEVKRVLKSQARWFEGNGLAPGTMITPDGSSYVTRRAAYHRGKYDELRAAFEGTERLETAATGISVVGKSAMIVGSSTGVAAAAGAVASIGGQLGSLAIEMFQVQQQNRLANAWVDSLRYWVADLRHAPAVTTELVDWIEQEAMDPTIQQVEGSIESVDLGGTNVAGTTYALANAPTYPGWWWSPTPLWKRIGVNTVTVENTGSTPADVRIISVDTYGDGRTTGVSDAVSYVPQEDEPAETLQPGETATFEHEYASDFHPFSPLNWHYMSTTLWMDGVYADELERPYYIVPSLNVLPFAEPQEDDFDAVLEAERTLSEAEILEQPIETESYVITDGSKPAGEAMTVDDWTNHVGDISELLNTDLTPQDPSVTTDHAVADDTAGVVFLLGTTPGTELNLHVRDQQGNHVGYDPSTDDDAVEIPDAEYSGHESTVEVVSIDEASGSYDVTVDAVSFDTESPEPVSLYVIEIPERESILTVLSDTINEVLVAGERTTGTITVGEVGEQAGIDVTGVQAGTLTNASGDSLAGVDIALDPGEFDLAAGQQRSIDVAFDTGSSLDLPDSPETRFSTPITISTRDTGTAQVTASVLLLRTTIDEARLASATDGVEGVSLSSADPAELPDLPDGATFIAGYTVDAIGNGQGTIEVPAETDTPAVYTLQGETWTRQHGFVDGETITIDFSAPADGVTVAVAQGPDDRTGSDPVVVGDRPASDVDGDGAYEDVNGDGEATATDVQALFANRNSEAIRNDPDAFDFNGDGEFSISDVQALFSKLF